jgi:hypothetical protein
MTLTEKPYPPPPWRSKNQMWMGAFAVDTPPVLPDGLRPLLSPRWVVLGLIRYLEGSTLTYDELVIASLARRGFRTGLYVHHIWVDSEASLWGGRRIWGLNKELATFAWEGDTVRVTDEAGPIVTMTVDRAPRTAPWLPAIAPGFGRLDGQWVHVTGSLRARFGKADLRIEAWSPRFPFQLAGAPRFAVAANPAEVTVPAPVVLGSG